MQDPASDDYVSLQQVAVDLVQEQIALRNLTKELQAEFATAMNERDLLLTEWRGALHRHDAVPTRETVTECQNLAQAVQGIDTRLIELATIRRDVRQYRRKLRRETSRASIYALRARRALDHTLFAVSLSPASLVMIGETEAQSLFHDMREHLTVAVLAAGKLGTYALPPTAVPFHDSLIRGLTGLTEDLDVLNPVRAEPRPRPMLTLLPPLVPPTESAPIPGT